MAAPAFGKFIVSMLAVLTVMRFASDAQALTLVVRVNPSTWAVTQYLGSGTAWVQDQECIYTDAYNNQYFRRYTAGSFDYVVIESSESPYETLDAFDANNIFYIVRSNQAAYTCSAGGSNGVNGTVYTARSCQNGDLYIGGEFTSAGGQSNSSYLSCYRWSSGWSGISGIYANNVVSGLSWNGSYQLVITGSFDYVYGPLSSGGGSGALFDYPPLLNDYYEDFGDRWFSAD